MDVSTAQYKAAIAHFDNCLILFAVNGSKMGNDIAKDSNEMSDEICGNTALIAAASVCEMGKCNGLPWMALSSYRA